MFKKINKKQVLFFSNNDNNIKVLKIALNLLEVSKIHIAHDIYEAINVIDTNNISLIIVDLNQEKQLSLILKYMKVNQYFNIKEIQLVLFDINDDESSLIKNVNYKKLANPIVLPDLYELLSKAIA